VRWADLVEDLLEGFITQRVSQNRSAAETSRLLRREVGKPWAGRSIHAIGKRDVVDLISAIVQRGASGAANKTPKSLKTFLRWCVGQAVLNRSPAEGVPSPTKEVARDRVLTDMELAQVILAARRIGGPYAAIAELLALTGQRREEVACLEWDELDLAQRIWTAGKHRDLFFRGGVHEIPAAHQSLLSLSNREKFGTLAHGNTGIVSSTPAPCRGQAEFRLGALPGAAVDGAEDGASTSNKRVHCKCQHAKSHDNVEREIRSDPRIEAFLVVGLALLKKVGERPPVHGNPFRHSSARMRHAFDVDQDFSPEKHRSKHGDPAAYNP
jgi:hypothetical protein